MIAVEATMEDRALIEDFGKANDWVAAFGDRGVPLTRSAIYEWKRNGIPNRWRPMVVEILRERGKKVPAGLEPTPAAGQ